MQRFQPPTNDLVQYVECQGCKEGVTEREVDSSLTYPGEICHECDSLIEEGELYRLECGLYVDREEYERLEQEGEFE